MTPGTDAVTVHGSTSGQQSAVQRGRANGERGKRAERDLVAWLRAHGWPGAERTVRTGHRVRGRVSADRGDIDGTPALVWQVKDILERDHCRIPQWLAETEAQRVAAGADYGLLVIKRRGHADPGDWWLWLPLGDLMHEALSWATHHPRDLYAVPVRLTVRDAAPILHHAGYGDAA